MNEIERQLALKARLDRTWSAFFSKHGNFTSTQCAAIPVLLDGANVMLCAPTASGKTEAVLAPLIERHVPRSQSGFLTILYLTPTKALVNDLRVRLSIPLDALRIGLGVKTRDLNTVSKGNIPTILITTPESCDSLLASQPRAFLNLRAVIIDELHLFDATPRGDQLRVILNRIRRIRGYAAQCNDAPDAEIQYAAISASLPQPKQATARYFSDATVIEIGGARPVQAKLIALSPDYPAELVAYLDTFRAHHLKKALVFCNTRAEVEAYAAAVHEQSPFGDAVFVHYSNLEAKHRRDIEQRFAASPVAICFASSTLELGIDIGSIDVILLIGAPGSVASFIQRAGRGSRRQSAINIACFYRTELEKRLFEVLSSESGKALTETTVGRFRPAVAVQQIFSLLKQNPAGVIRLSELDSLFEGLLTDESLRTIVGQLESLHYLYPARSGEWRAGERLNRLIDQQANPHQTLSLYSNIKGYEGRKIEIRDQNTQETIARVDAQWLDRDILTLEGRVVDVEWYDGDALWITPSPDRQAADKLRYMSSRQLLSFDLAQKLMAQFGLVPNNAPLVETPVGWLWFHWLGDLYGQALRDLVAGHLSVKSVSQIGLCLLLSSEPQHVIAEWTNREITRYLEDNYIKFESMLDLGPYQHLLPTALRRQTVIEQFNVPAFQTVLGKLSLFRASESLASELQSLLGS
ncbi:MAG: DEAD/DEAH box helicase [Chloroflexota bacterium]